MKYLWILASKDKYEFPIYIEDSASKLAVKCGCTANLIHSCISKYGNKGKFKKVELI